jgi:hypothetical protein
MGPPIDLNSSILTYLTATPDPIQRVLDPGHREHPSILVNGIITPEEVDKLFNMYVTLCMNPSHDLIFFKYSYFEYMNLSLSLLDPVLYTAHNTYYRSPFLFTVSKCSSQPVAAFPLILHVVSLRRRVETLCP